ncbi:MAG TPA: dihydropyrimidinase [Patescibacteria group bacterium]|nr:dihydropyrimidinase [Patescibacteria group bacterium]
MLIRGGTVIDQDGVRRADVLIEGERIAAVGPDLEPHGGHQVVDAGGAYVIPGAIDVHTHFDLPVGSLRSADDFASGTLAAACGGTTCVIDFAGAGREMWTEALDAWHARAAGRAVIDYGFHLTVTELPETVDGARVRFRQFAERGVTSVKLYMAYPDRLMVDDATLGRALAASPETGVRVCVHAEDGLEIARRQAALLAAGKTEPSAIPEVRPPGVEAAAIGRAARLAREAEAELYVVHLSSAEGLAAVLEARGLGSVVRAETCPQYLYLDEERLRDPIAGQDFVCSPPVRRAEDRAALWRAVATSAVEVVSTDHCPFTLADRRLGTAGREGGWRDFTEIPGGLPGVETRLALTYRAVADGRISLERWVDAVAGAPARLFGLAGRKGALRPGSDADAVVFDPRATRRLDAKSLHSRSDHSPYAGMEVTGGPALTISRGRIVASSGEPADADPGWGRFVPRAPSVPSPRSRR